MELAAGSPKTLSNGGPRIRVRRLGYALGAEITGVDLTGAIDDPTVAQIRQAWLEHIVLIFPGQDLTPSTLMAFASRFGELDDNRQTPNLRHPDYPEVYVLANKPTTIGSRSFTGGISNNWHTDNSFTLRAATGTFLNAKVLPAVGGDTMFANMYAAYETLSPALRAILDGLEGVHDIALGGLYSQQSPELQAERRRMNPPVVHPVVCVHPETGRKALYVGSKLRNFVGMTPEETKPLRDFLSAHSTAYEFIYRHRWSVNDLLMWDNRCTLHYAVPDYDRSQTRTMIRCNLLAPKTGRLYESE